MYSNCPEYNGEVPSLWGEGTDGKVHFQSTPEEKNQKNSIQLPNTVCLVSNESSVIEECIEHVLYTLGSLVSELSQSKMGI